jgi:UDP-N-acetylglucosamine 2-epimerase (non-hydrolysing)
VFLADPFTYTDFMGLQINSYCVLSDSGSISEESSLAGFPAVTLRLKTERPEAVEGGVLPSVGLDLDLISTGIRLATSRTTTEPLSSYSQLDFSHRVLNIILSGLSSLSKN